MSDFLQMNLNRMSGIRDKTGRIADRRAAAKEAKRQGMSDAFKTAGDVYAKQKMEESMQKIKAEDEKDLVEARFQVEKKLADKRYYAEKIKDVRLEQYKKDEEKRMDKSFEDGSFTLFEGTEDEITYNWDTDEEYELKKKEMDAYFQSLVADQRTLDAIKTAENLAEVRREESKTAFDQEKQIMTLDAQDRESLATLEASLMDEGEVFNEDAAYSAAMSYGLAPIGIWEGPHWKPEVWTQDIKDQVIERIETNLSKYNSEQASDVMGMVMLDLNMYDFTPTDEFGAKAGTKLPKGAELGKTFLTGLTLGNPLLMGASAAAIKNIMDAPEAAKKRAEAPGQIHQNFTEMLSKFQEKDAPWGIPDDMHSDVQDSLTDLPNNLSSEHEKKLTNLIDEYFGFNFFGKADDFKSLNDYIDDIMQQLSSDKPLINPAEIRTDVDLDYGY